MATALNDLVIPDSNRRRLQELLEQEAKLYQTNLENLTDEATETIAEVRKRYPMELRSTIEEYARESSRITNDHYTVVRSLWEEFAGVTLPEYAPDVIDTDYVVYRMHEVPHLKMSAKSGVVPHLG